MRLPLAAHDQQTIRGYRISFVGLAFDQLDVAETVDALVRASRSGRAHYLVTPNVDHVVRLSRHLDVNDPVANAYRQADVCVCDSRVLASLCRLKGQAMTVAPGSDITGALVERLVKAGERRCIAVVGMEPNGFAALTSKYPSLNFHHVRAPFGLATDAEARTLICRQLKALDAAFVLLAVGSPQQELIAREFAVDVGVRGALLCIGASLDFLVGTQKRAPHRWQKLGLEWAYRLIQNPTRMWRRYLYEGPAILLIALASSPRRLEHSSADKNTR